MTPPYFAGPLEVRRIRGDRWMLLRALEYHSAVAKAQIIVPPEFITDFASVPRLPFVYWTTGGRAQHCAVIHDWLYQHAAWEDRPLADAVFREAMGVDQPEFGFEAESTAIRALMWSGVRAAGVWAWRNDKRAATLNPIWTHAGWPVRVEMAAG